MQIEGTEKLEPISEASLFSEFNVLLFCLTDSICNFLHHLFDSSTVMKCGNPHVPC